VQEPDTKSLTVKDGDVMGFGSGTMVIAAFAMDGLCFVMDLEF